jgi:hypothetical protein
MVKILLKISLLIGLGFFLFLMPPRQAYAQWPPFDFRLSPTFESGKIKYNIRFVSRFDGAMTNVTFKVPLPPGTRFLEANAQANTQANFDGAEVIFFTANLSVPIKDASFVVEITDPKQTVFTTHAWIGWEGDQPGNFLAKDVAVDTTLQPLEWEAPFTSRLQLETRAVVTDDVVTYLFYPKNIESSSVRMQDLKINVPLPAGSTFLSVEAPASFSANFDGHEVSFFTLELAQDAEVTPLSFKVSTEGVTAPTLATHAWATWKNAGKRVGIAIVAQEEITSGDIVVQPGTSQWAAADLVGDVPFSNYDLTGVAFEAYSAGLQITFNTAGDIGPVGEPLEFNLYLDADCNAGTGTFQSEIGADYRIKYDHSTGKTRLDVWQDDGTTEKWQSSAKVELVKPVTTKIVALWLPYTALKLPDKSHFCWAAQAKNNLTIYSPSPPTDNVQLIQQDLRLAVSPAAPPPLVVASARVTATKTLSGTLIELGDEWNYFPGWYEPPAAWNTLDFDPGDWFTGPTSIGYGEGRARTDLKDVELPLGATDKLPTATGLSTTTIVTDLPNGDKGSLFMRRVFNVPDPTILTQLTLKMKYEGGFVAYLNGVEVARRNLGETDTPVPFDAPATKNGEKTSEDIDLNSFIETLVAGDNVLAIQAHRALADLNLSVNPKLSWRGKSALPAPGDSLQVTTPGTAPADTAAPQPVIADITGKLAVPLDKDRIAYDVHIFSMPDGQENVTIPNARQPNFRPDGQRLLINREGGGAENLFEYNLADGIEKAVSDAPKDSHPFYDSFGNRVVYGNPELTVGSGIPLRDKNGNLLIDGDNDVLYKDPRRPFIFVQCGLLPPHQETEPRCRDIPSLGVLVPAGQMGEIEGTHPVWTNNDMIAYNGCNSWAGSRLCGIYIVPAVSTKGFSNGFIPRQLTRDSSDLPADTKDNLITFTSHRDGNWEAYVMNLDGQGVINLSASPDSNDGLPTISPDGNWVAFVSDREGAWAVWVTPAQGGTPQKLFDLPAAPWGDGDRAWTNERISWGP